MADRVLVMEHGQIAINGRPQEAAALIASGVCQDMFHGLPAAAKIASAITAEGNFPLTVRDGRLWLEERLGPPEFEASDSGKTHRIRPRHANPKDESAEPSVISMHDVWFRYARTASDILRGVKLEVRKGELFAILGGNGVGKTTTLKALTRLIKPYRGTIEISGKRLETLSDAELFSHCLAMLPQNPQALFTEITLREELSEALSDEPFSPEEQAARVASMAAEMELDSLMETHPYDLSGGEQQRLALGKILLRQPAILLLDEPTKGLDPLFKRTLAGIFKKLQHQGITILMVTHDIEFCAEYADRCALFFDGEIVSCAAPNAFFSGNNFYTTTANRVAGQWFPDAVTWEEVASRCGEVTTSAS